MIEMDLEQNPELSQRLAALLHLERRAQPANAPQYLPAKRPILSKEFSFLDLGGLSKGFLFGTDSGSSLQRKRLSRFAMCQNPSPDISAPFGTRFDRLRGTRKSRPFEARLCYSSTIRQQNQPVLDGFLGYRNRKSNGAKGF